MKKPFRLIVVVLLALSVALLPGCLPKLKDGAALTPPSWKVPVQVPLIKKHLVLNDLLTKLDIPEMDNISVEENTELLQFAQDLHPDPLKLDIPDLNQAVDEFTFPTIHWDSAAFQVNVPNSYNVTYEYDIDLGVGDLEIPSQSLPLLTPDTLIEIPFSSIKLSNSLSNSIHFTLTSDEPFDGLTLQLVDMQGQPIGSVVDFGSEAGGASVPQYTRERTLNLSGESIPQQMKFQLTVQAHSTSGHIKLDIAMSDTLEVVELIPDATDPDNPLLNNIPQIQIPQIKPLADYALIQEIKFTSGKIRFSQTQSHTQDHPFPFDIDLSQLAINGDTSRFSQEPNGDIILDLSGLSLTPSTTISGAHVALGSNPVYDVWDDATQTIVPYNFDMAFNCEDMEIEYIKGDSSMIDELVPDPNPATPGVWDYLFTPASSFEEIKYPGSVSDLNLGLTDIFLTMNLDNRTSLQGDFTLTVVACSDQYGHPMMKDGQPLEATFSIHVEPRTNTEFAFNEQDDYAKFIQIINSKPPYLEYSYEGLLSLPDTFTLTPDDAIDTSFSISLPMTFTIGPGGATIADAYKETITLSAEQMEQLELAEEFLDEATLNVRYNNQSDLGLGGRLTFRTPDGREETVSTVVFNNRSGVAALKVTRDLLDILQNEAGFDLTCDLIIPNDSTESRTMSFNASDGLDVTVWVDAKVRAHVPDQQ